MPKHMLLAGCLLWQGTGAVFAGYSVNVINANWGVNTPIAAGNPVGITASQSFANISQSLITDVSVNLDISGGFNGGLYGYLVLQSAGGPTATEILLNLVGTSSSNPIGSAGAGFNNITLSDAGTVNGSIHGATGIPTGTWLPDSVKSLGQTFGGLNPNGTWTLFLADLDAGTASPTLESWGLNVNAVPEPGQTAAMALLGLAGLGVVVVRRVRRRSAA